MLHERYERNLGSIGHPMKHRFTEKCAADRHPVKSTGELALSPGFDRMRVTEIVQPHIALDNFTIDPSILTFRASLDHVRKGMVDLDLEKVFSQSAAQRVWHMKIFQWNNRARIGREPPDGVVFHRHRKNTEPIALQQEIRL